MTERQAKFAVGQLVRHKLFGYRGVIVDVDGSFLGSEEWYDYMARSRPPKDHPWYHVLVHDAEHATYVAQRNLEPDGESAPVNHPAIDEYFAGLRDGRYVARQSVN